VKGGLAKSKSQEVMTVLGVFCTYREAVNALVELRERFSTADIAVIVRYKGKPVPVGLDMTAVIHEPDYCEAEFWGSPTCVFVRANSHAREVQTYFHFCCAQRVETRDPSAPSTPM
jgi:hypothetical protein